MRRRLTVRRVAFQGNAYLETTFGEPRPGNTPNAIVSHYDASCRDGGLCADAYLAPLVRGIPRPPHAVLA
jgi:hypothetical protein